MRKTSNSNKQSPPNNRFSNNNNSNIDRQAEKFRNKFPDSISIGLKERINRNKEESQSQEEARQDSLWRKYQELEHPENQEHNEQQQEYSNMYVAKDKPEDYYTGEKNRKLLVHIIENGVEVTKPIRKRIYDQQVIWRKRIFPIDIKQTIVDAKGVHHLYVSANDMAILNFKKDHADHCRKCNGKMFIDARNARDLLKRNTIQAIWGIDSTHMILLLVFAVAAMAAIGFAFYSFNQDTRHTAELTAEKAKTLSQNTEIGLLQNQTRTLQNLLISRDNPLPNNPNTDPNTPIPPTLPRPRTSEPIT